MGRPNGHACLCRTSSAISKCATALRRSRSPVGVCRRRSYDSCAPFAASRRKFWISVTSSMRGAMLSTKCTLLASQHFVQRDAPPRRPTTSIAGVGWPALGPESTAAAVAAVRDRSPKPSSPGPGLILREDALLKLRARFEIRAPAPSSGCARRHTSNGRRATQRCGARVDIVEVFSTELRATVVAPSCSVQPRVGAQRPPVRRRRKWIPSIREGLRLRDNWPPRRC